MNDFDNELDTKRNAFLCMDSCRIVVLDLLCT